MQECLVKSGNKIVTISGSSRATGESKIVTLSTEKKKNTAIPLAGAVINEPLPTQIIDCLKNNPTNYVTLIFDHELKLIYFGEKNGVTIGLSVRLSQNVSLPNVKFTGPVVTAKVNSSDIYDELKFYSRASGSLPGTPSYFAKSENINIPIYLMKGEKSIFLQIDNTKFDTIN